MSKGSLYTGFSTDKKTTSFLAYLHGMGITKNNYTISRSVTDFGKSNYIKLFDNDFREHARIRISDHSVGQRRLGDEWSYDIIVKNIHGYKTDFEKVVRYLKSRI